MPKGRPKKAVPIPTLARIVVDSRDARTDTFVLAKEARALSQQGIINLIDCGQPYAPSYSMPFNADDWRADRRTKLAPEVEALIKATRAASEQHGWKMPNP